MVPEEANLLVSGIERTHPEYNGWEFAYEYPGFFVYYKRPFAVYFTPEHSYKGLVDIQIMVNDQEDKRFPGADVVFDPRTAERLFEIVRPFLDSVDSRRFASNGTH